MTQKYFPEGIKQVVTSESSSGNLTIASGNVMFAPYYTVSSSDTVVVNGDLLSMSAVTVNGVLTINGTAKIISI